VVGLLRFAASDGNFEFSISLDVLGLKVWGRWEFAPKQTP
jgi:hypothetical protein